MKLRVYAREMVRHVWMVDPVVKTLEVYRLEGERYLLLDTWARDERPRAEPFAEVEFELAALWLPEVHAPSP